MTSVVVWQVRELDETNFATPHVWERDIWIAADSRISTASDDHSGRRVFTDVAPKILPIHLDLFERSEQGPGVNHRYNGELGFAYAGNTLPANMTYSVVVSSLARMTAEFDAELPLLEDIVAFITRVGSNYACEIGAPFEAFVTGTCPRDPHGGATVYHLLLWSNKAPSFHRLQFDADHRMYLLGNRKDELRAICRAGFAADISYNPTQALGQLIAESAVGEIGGLLSLARVESQGGITLFPGFGAAESGGRLPATFDGNRFGSIGMFKVGLQRA